MHDTHDTPTLDAAKARWDAAHAAVTAHSAKGWRNDEPAPEDEAEREAWDAEHAAWVSEWDRLQGEARAAVVALHRARQAGSE
ncbi:hypothetical protein ACWDT6_30280 [Nocardia grenadensis]